MSKKKQTNTKKLTTLEDILFPSSLVGKQLGKLEYFEINNKKESNFSEKCEDYLDKYLREKNPDHLFRAINENSFILQGASKFRPNRVESSDDNLIDAYTIVWESIHFWQYLGSLNENEFICKEAEKLLKNIGTALIVKRKSYNLYQTYGINHYTPASKGVAEIINVEIEQCSRLIEIWSKIESVIKPIRKKFKNNKSEKNKLIEYLYKGIDENLENELKVKVPISLRDVKQFNLTTVNLTVASVLAHIHSEIHCEYCKTKRSKKISPRRIYELYRTCR